MSNKPNCVTEVVWSHIRDNPQEIAAIVPDNGLNEFDARNSMSRVTGDQKPTVRPGTISVTWEEYGHMVAEVSLFLQSKQVKKGDRIAILSWNSIDWMVLNRAAACLDAVVVPLYPNTTADQIAHVLNDSAPVLIVSESQKLLETMVDPRLLSIEHLDTALFSEVMQNVPSLSGKMTAWKGMLRPFGFRLEAAAEFNRLKEKFTLSGAVDQEAISTLIYTSGSTGLPKGAMLSNGNIAASCALLTKVGFGFGRGDINMHYLPLAHIYGKVNGMELAEYMGVISGYALPTALKEALPAHRPTVIFGVPRVWNRYRAEIEKEAGNSGIKAKLLRWALAQKPGSFGSWLAKRFVYTSIRKKLGMDAARILITGSAAIPRETIDFFIMLGLDLREAYGATETCGGIFANTLTDNRFGSLGKPGPGVEMRIEPRPEIDTEPNTGILWVRGDFIFKGYWNLPNKTAEVLTADGWYNTGDIVHMDEDGFAWFRGRAKRQKKLDTGEFYAEEAIETALTGRPILSAAVATGEGRPCVGALIFIDPSAAKQIAGAAPEGVNPLEFYAGNAAVRAAVQAAVDEANAAILGSGVGKKWEQVRKWEIVAIEPTVDNGLLTPTLKIKNEEVLRRYADVVTRMYA